MKPPPSFARALRLAPRRLLMAPVRLYRFFLSPWLGSACRFEPTCSAYALQALETHGAAAGSWLAAGRLLRCHPWCAGGHDPVPQTAPKIFTRLLAAREGGEDSRTSQLSKTTTP